MVTPHVYSVQLVKTYPPHLRPNANNALFNRSNPREANSCKIRMMLCMLCCPLCTVNSNTA